MCYQTVLGTRKGVPNSSVDGEGGGLRLVDETDRTAERPILCYSKLTWERGGYLQLIDSPWGAEHSGQTWQGGRTFFVCATRICQVRGLVSGNHLSQGVESNTCYTTESSILCNNISSFPLSYLSIFLLKLWLNNELC